MKKALKHLLAAVLLTLLAAVCAVSASAAKDGNWITAWGTGSTNVGLKDYDNIAAFVGQVSARTVITPTASGSKVRVRLSNHFGTEPLTIETCTVAKSLGGSYIDTASTRIVTFNGGEIAVTIPAGGEVISDECKFNVTAMQDIAMSIFLKDFNEVRTMGLSGGETYINLSENDATRNASFGLVSKIDSTFVKVFESAGFGLDRSLSYSIIHVVPIFTSFDVYSGNPDAYSVVVVGDSTVSNNFPLYLSEEINKQGIDDVGVVGKGIIGNSLGTDGLGFGSFLFGESMMHRFARDVLSQSGVKYVIVKIGTNDIVHPVCRDVQSEYPGIKQPTAQEIIENFRTIFRTCHENNIRVIAVGITQFKGYSRNFLNTGARYVRTDEEFQHDWQIALDVNEWLATTTEHDGYVDYYDLTKNPDDPLAMKPEYTLDGAHPTELMQQVWAQNFPLSLIGVGSGVGYVRLNAGDAELRIGQTKQLTATVYPSTATNKTVIWTSSNASVATVNQNGLVTAVGDGTCDIIATTAEGARTAACKVTVTIPVTGVSLAESNIAIYTTKTETLHATVYPTNASNQTLTWTTGNKNIATVSAAGVVTGVGSGSTTIKCTTNDGKFSAVCIVNVYKKVEVESLAININEKALYVGGSVQLTSATYPTTATFPEVTWKTSNNKVATVDETGLVKAVGPGKATITCASVDNPFITQKCFVTVSIQVTGVRLDTEAVSLYETATRMLVPTVLPENATNKAVLWSSSDTSVATVDKNGVVTAVKQGTAIITCTTKDSEQKARCTVTVLKTILSKSVSLDRTTLTLKDGKTATLVATIKPDNVSINTVTWKSSNKKVAKVNQQGLVRAIAPGTCTITVTTKDTGKTATCTVTVKPQRVTGVTLNKSAVKIYIDGTYKLVATVAPATATNKKVVWSTSNRKIVKVSSKGYIRGISAGNATVTCTTEDGQKVATCTVKVRAPKIQSLAIPEASVTLGTGQKYTIVVLPTPATANASPRNLKFSSSDKSVAKVNKNGVVVGIAEGTAIITIMPNDGGNGKGTLLVVKVENVPVVGVKMSKSLASIKVGATLTLTATVLPENATNKKITWSSTDTNVCKVNQNGLVTAVGPGNCYIRAVAADGGAVGSCHVYTSY
ncbi:MAG: Ig-like domain-containing protein [Clostridia bacterium]|nr:Ig-like domain-containing protein [Clostridia bacterium]